MIKLKNAKTFTVNGTLFYMEYRDVRLCEHVQKYFYTNNDDVVRYDKLFNGFRVLLETSGISTVICIGYHWKSLRHCNQLLHDPNLDLIQRLFL